MDAATLGHPRSVGEIVSLPLDRLDLPDQPRTVLKPLSIQQLAESLKAQGQLQPIRVQFNTETKRWRVLFGARRTMAAMLAGWTHIQAVVVPGDLSEASILTDQLIENLHRDDLKPVEEALKFAELGKRLGLNPAKLAEHLHKDLSHISRRLALLKYAPGDQALIDEEQISECVAYEISKVPDSKRMQELFHQAVEERWTLERACRAVDTVATRRKSPAASDKPLRRLRIPLANGASVAVASDADLTPDALLDALALAHKEAKKALQGRIELGQLAEYFRERCKRPQKANEEAA